MQQSRFSLFEAGAERAAAQLLAGRFHLATIDAGTAVVLSADDGFCSLLGSPAEDVTGTPLGELWGVAAPVVKAVMRAPEGSGPVEVVAWPGSARERTLAVTTASVDDRNTVLLAVEGDRVAVQFGMDHSVAVWNTGSGPRVTSTLSTRLPSRSTTSKRQPSQSTWSAVIGRRPSSSMIMPASVL